MFDSRRYLFQSKRDQFGILADVPYLPLILTYQNRSVDTMGLLDTGASVNGEHPTFAKIAKSPVFH